VSFRSIQVSGATLFSLSPHPLNMSLQHRDPMTKMKHNLVQFFQFIVQQK